MQESFLIKLQVSGPQACNFIKTSAQVCSYEFLEISKNNFFTGHLPATAFGCMFYKKVPLQISQNAQENTYVRAFFKIKPEDASL